MGRDADFASRAGPSYAPRCLSSFRQITVRGGCFRRRSRIRKEGLRRFVAGAADHGSAGVSTRSIAPARYPVEAKHTGRQRGGTWQGAIRVFRGRHPCRRSAREPAVTDTRRAIPWTPGRTEGGAASRSSGRTGAPFRLDGGGRLLKKTRGKWRRPPAAARTRRERCLWKSPRYSPLRELATARRQAVQRGGPAALPAATSAINRKRSASRSRRDAETRREEGTVFLSPRFRASA
jgi:hypothetical protein